VQHEGVLNFAVDSRIPSSGGGAEVMVSLMDRVVVPSHVLVRFLDKESVLLNIETERYFGLDETGTRMWQLVTAAPKIEVAYQQLLDEYDVEPGLLRENLTDLLSRLVENGLLQVTSFNVGTPSPI
jgi:Coenzyme PQQ synthesis protein D (PqqD)